MPKAAKSKSKSKSVHMHMPKNTADVPECAICMQPLGPAADAGHAPTFLPDCKHRIHVACLHKWVSEVADPLDKYLWRRSKSCPTCRTQLGPVSLAAVGFFDTPPDAPEVDWMWGGSDDQRLAWAARTGNAAYVRKLLNEGHPLNNPCYHSNPPEDGGDALFSQVMLEAVAHEGQPDVVRAILEFEDEMDADNDYHEHFAQSIASEKRYGLCEAARRGHVELVNLFMAHGALLNDPDSDEAEETPLHAASGAQKMEMVNFLLDKGADIEAIWYEYGMDCCSSGTVLMCACQSGNFEIAKALLARGADPSHYDEDDCGPLEFAVKQYIFTYDIDARREEAWQLELVRLLCSDSRVDIRHKNERGETVLEGLRKFYGDESAYAVHPVHVAELEAVLTAAQDRGRARR